MLKGCIVCVCVRERERNCRGLNFEDPPFLCRFLQDDIILAKVL